MVNASQLRFGRARGWSGRSAGLRRLLSATLVGCLVMSTLSQAAGYREGKALYDQGDLDRAIWVWQIAANAGDVDAQFSLGHMYFLGRGVAIDLAESGRWYRLAAQQGHAAAQLNLGNAYHFGRGVPIDEAQAVRWWTLAAKQDVAGAQFNLGINYARGLGVERDARQSLQWFRRAADNGHVRALALLELGQPLAVDASPKDSAMRWLLDQDPNYFTLQLLADQDQDAVRRFAASTTLTEPIALIRYLRNSVVWYALVHGSYPSHPAAAKASQELAETHPRLAPWVRRFASVHADMRASLPQASGESMTFR